MDCIDLNENEYQSITSTIRSASPTISIRTVSEFGEPNSQGHAKKKKPLSANSNKLMGQIQTVMGTVIGTGQGNANMRLRHPVKYPEDSEENQHHHEKQGGKNPVRNMSCWALIFLLAVDAFTIGLVVVLFSHYSSHTPRGIIDLLAS